MKLNIPIIVLSLFLFIYLIPHSARPLFAPDETRYVEIAREMIVSGDFVTPRLDGVRYFEKPPMGYWLIAGSELLFGESVFGARFAQVLATGLTALIIMFLTRKITGNEKLSYIAAGIYLLMPLTCIIGTICTLDALFTVFVAASIGAFYCAMQSYETETPAHGKYYGWLVITGLMAGCAFLTKGFLGFALPAAAVAPWLIWEKRWKQLFVSPWIPLAVALIIIAPWALMIHHAEPDYWRYFIMEEHIHRFFGGEKAQHANGPFYFVLTFLWGTAEWLLLFPVMCAGWRHTGIKSSWMKFLICWGFFPFLLLSISSGKLPPYILPCFPAYAILFAIGLNGYFEKKNCNLPENTQECTPIRHKLFNIPLMYLAGIMVVALPVSCYIIGKWLPELTQEVQIFTCLKKPLTIIPADAVPVVLFQEKEQWKLLLCFNAGVLAIIGLAGAIHDKKPWRKISFFMLSFLPLMICSFFVVPQSIYDCRCPMSFMNKHQSEVDSNTILVAHGASLLHAACLAFHRTDVYPFYPGEIEYGLKYPEEKGRQLNFNLFVQLIKNNPDKKVVAFYPTDRFIEAQEKGYIPNPDLHYQTMVQKEDGISMLIYLPAIPAPATPTAQTTSSL